MSTVQDLEKKEESLESQLSACRASLEIARQDAIGVHIGDIVLSKDGKKIKVASFSSWCKSDSKYQHKPWLEAYHQKKDGTWRENRTRFFDDWSKP